VRLNPSPSRARRAALLALTTAFALLAGTAAAWAGPIAPDAGSGSPNAEGIRELYLIIFVLACIIFFGVGGLIIYTAFKFKARKGAVAAQIHGNNRLEVGWTVGAALLLVVISVITFLKLPQIDDPPNSGPDGVPVTKQGSFVADGAKQRLPPNGRSLSITVNGQQYLWRYTYEDGDGNNLNNVYAYEEMVAPLNTTVTLKIRANDVQHSWWIPDLGGKFDAVPGYTNFTWFKATKPGTYLGQCAELCGRNHANMTARVRIVSPQEFEAWYARQKAQIRLADKQAAAKREDSRRTTRQAAGLSAES
jgi:cytochrome c oxidase subunit 2